MYVECKPFLEFSFLIADQPKNKNISNLFKNSKMRKAKLSRTEWYKSKDWSENINEVALGQNDNFFV